MKKEARDQCDQIWRNYATLAKKSAIVTKFGGSFSIWHIVQQTLANFLWYLQICIVVNGQILYKSSGNLVTLPRMGHFKRKILKGFVTEKNKFA